MDTIEFKSMDTPGGALSTGFLSPNCFDRPAAQSAPAPSAKPVCQTASAPSCPQASVPAACPCAADPVQGASCPLPAKQQSGVPAQQSAGAPVTCPDGHITFGQCETTRVEVLPNMQLDEDGRVLEVAMTLLAICPNRRVAVGIMLTEVDPAGNEHPRGFKAIAVDAHHGNCCADIAVQRTRFILPESLRVDGCTGVCQGRRHFIVRAEAHYIDITA